MPPNYKFAYNLTPINIHYILVGGFGGFNPSEKYESQLGWLFPIYGEKKGPNHQFIYIMYIYIYDIC